MDQTRRANTPNLTGGQEGYYDDAPRQRPLELAEAPFTRQDAVRFSTPEPRVESSALPADIEPSVESYQLACAMLGQPYRGWGRKTEPAAAIGSSAGQQQGGSFGYLGGQPSQEDTTRLSAASRLPPATMAEYHRAGEAQYRRRSASPSHRNRGQALSRHEAGTYDTVRSYRQRSPSRPWPAHEQLSLRAQPGNTRSFGYQGYEQWAGHQDDERGREHDRYPDHRHRHHDDGRHGETPGPRIRWELERGRASEHTIWDHQGPNTRQDRQYGQTLAPYTVRHDVDNPVKNEPRGSTSYGYHRKPHFEDIPSPYSSRHPDHHQEQGFQAIRRDRKPSPESARRNQEAGFSANYAGDISRQNNRPENIHWDENCSIYISGLPPNLTYHQFLGAVRSCGRVFQSHITHANPEQGHYFSHGKLTFFHRYEAETFYNRYHAFGFPVCGIRGRVMWNRVLVSDAGFTPAHSRVLVLRGPPFHVNKANIERILKGGPNAMYWDEDEVIESRGFGPDGRAEATIEFRFASFRNQAQTAHMMLTRPEGLRRLGVQIWWGKDPCQ
ncbi:hypothetical protein B0T17DRAFT_599746 [Bombardia bombarda]|uniref:Uncharacterized protein n=1 Tax=Bombardia bombarda TaxID=252184 RepID=A0AA39X1N0_9PEZI|nr:hypothetical protein B0T17DRAFT_599746 [Bombardia bombarda]